MSTLNRYSYALNNPLIYIDPTGHSSITVSIGAGSGGSSYWGSDPWGQYSHFSEPARGGGGAGSGSSSAGADAPSVPANTQSAGNYQAGLNYIDGGLTDFGITPNSWFSGLQRYFSERAESHIAAGRNFAALIDHFGIAAVEVFLPQKTADLPWLVLGNIRVLKHTKHVHHLLPRQYKTYFKAAVLNINEEKYLRVLDVEFHKRIHGKGGGDAWYNSWNRQWKRFKDRNPDATLPGLNDKILEELERIMKYHGLE